LEAKEQGIAMALEDKETKRLPPEDIEALAQVKSMIAGFNEAQLKLVRRFIDFLIKTHERKRSLKGRN
jgi:hypothetical protein